jgi:hypothetical protein
MSSRRIKVRVFADDGQSLQYSNTSFRIWGMNVTWPLLGLDVSCARKSGSGIVDVGQSSGLASAQKGSGSLHLHRSTATMPELPEVDRAKNLLNTVAAGKRIEKVETVEDTIVFSGTTHEDFVRSPSQLQTTFLTTYASSARN